MSRFAGLWVILITLLAGCGASITITLPDAFPGAATQAAAKPRLIPKGYERLNSPASYAFRYTRSGEPVRRGQVAERFTLKDGDCGGTDCGNPRYRAEIREQDRRVTGRLNTDIWYGWSFMNVNIGAVTRKTSLGTVIGQWKRDGDAPPVFRLAQTEAGEGNFTACDPAICTRGGAASDDVVIELPDMRAARGWGKAQNFGNICRLFSLAASKGQWVDIVVNTNFGTGPDGYLRVWVNGELRCNYTGQLVSEQNAARRGLGPIHRRGVFASYTTRWDQSQGGAPKPTLLVQYDEFLSGKSREAVDTRLREAAGLAPVD